MCGPRLDVRIPGRDRSSPIHPNRVLAYRLLIRNTPPQSATSSGRGTFTTRRCTRSTSPDSMPRAKVSPAMASIQRPFSGSEAVTRRRPAPILRLPRRIATPSSGFMRRPSGPAAGTMAAPGSASTITRTILARSSSTPTATISRRFATCRGSDRGNLARRTSRQGPRLDAIRLCDWRSHRRTGGRSSASVLRLARGFPGWGPTGTGGAVDSQPRTGIRIVAPARSAAATRKVASAVARRNAS